MKSELIVLIYRLAVSVSSVNLTLGLERVYHPCSTTDHSRAEKLWLVCGVMGDVMPCDRESDIHPSQKFDATIHSEKMTYLRIVLFSKR
jgi:hypothetical protein